MNTGVRRAMIALAVSVCCVVSLGCDGAEGTYSDAEDEVKVELRNDGKAFVSFGEAMTTAGEWEEDGDRIILTLSGDTTVLTRNDDGSLDGGMLLGKLTKE